MNPLEDQLIILNAKLAEIQTQVAAHQAAELLWMSQMLFLTQAGALACGIIWGCITYRLIILAKNQRSAFW